MKKCLLCESKLTTRYVTVNSFEIYKCNSCDILFTGNRSNRKYIEKLFYSNSYISDYKLRGRELRERFHEHLSKIEKYKHGGAILDIGCGLGYFLSVASNSKRYLWNINGLEKNTKLAINANKYLNGKVIVGSINNPPYKANTFDSVTCFDVLEHDYRFQNNLNQIKRVLKRNGILVIQAPNYYSLMAFLTGKYWFWWAPPDHVLHFSFHFLVSNLKKNNFEILEGYTYEKTEDFLLNIKVRIKNDYLSKTIYYLVIPALFILEYIGWLCNLGGLSFVIARKRE